MYKFEHGCFYHLSAKIFKYIIINLHIISHLNAIKQEINLHYDVINYDK